MEMWNAFLWQSSMKIYLLNGHSASPLDKMRIDLFTFKGKQNFTNIFQLLGNWSSIKYKNWNYDPKLKIHFSKYTILTTLFWDNMLEYFLLLLCQSQETSGSVAMAFESKVPLWWYSSAPKGLSGIVTKPIGQISIKKWFLKRKYVIIKLDICAFKGEKAAIAWCIRVSAVICNTRDQFTSNGMKPKF